MEFLKFWGRALWQSLGWGWVVFCVVSTIMPAAIAVFQHWFPKLSGIPLFKTISEYQAEIQIAIALLFIIPYLAYAPYKLYKMDVRKGEKLRGMIYNVVTGQLTSNKGKNAVSVAVLLEIQNSGEPTTPTGFFGVLKVGKQTVKLRPSFLPEDMEFSFGQRGISKIKRSDMLYEKLNNPIPQGGRIVGFLWFVAPTISFDEVDELAEAGNGVDITIFFKDVAGNEYHASPKWEPGKEDIGLGERGPEYVPGVENPFLPFVGRKPNGSSTPPPPIPDKGASPP